VGSLGRHCGGSETRFVIVFGGGVVESDQLGGLAPSNQRIAAFGSRLSLAEPVFEYRGGLGLHTGFQLKGLGLEIVSANNLTVAKERLGVSI
jgi:hypothetical protein